MSHRARCTVIKDQLERATNDKIRLMKQSELARANADFERRMRELEQAAGSGDIHASPVLFGTIAVRERRRAMSFLDEVRAKRQKLADVFIDEDYPVFARSLRNCTRTKRTSSTNCSKMPKMRVRQKRLSNSTADSVAFEHNGRIQFDEQRRMERSQISAKSDKRDARG